MAAQKDNGINMLSSIGCLPMLIQWPFFIALYNAAAYTTGISSSTFYGIPLGHPSIVLVIISGVLYFIQTWISTLSMTPAFVINFWRIFSKFFINTTAHSWFHDKGNDDLLNHKYFLYLSYVK